MEVIAEIRCRHMVSGESISSIPRDLKLSRPTVRKHLQTESEVVYQRQHQPAPKLGALIPVLEGWLTTEHHLPKAQRRTAQRLFEGLQAEGYRGAYDSVQRFVRQWKRAQTKPAIKEAFVPLVFAPGDACQFDWSQEHVEIGGVALTIKVAHFRLAYSRRMFVAAYPSETQEMVLDAHNRAFAFFGGVPNRLIYDNLKTVVDTVLRGKDRHFNRRFMALANHYLFEPVACTPASGWEKGQIENQVGNMREWLFTPKARFERFAALNDWLATRCRELAERKHPVEPTRTINDCFAQEKPSLRAITSPFDGYIEQMMRVSSTCLVRVERNRYSVPADFAGKVVSVRLYADHVRIVAENTIVAEHTRRFGRDQLICDPWHYLPVLENKPGSLRNGAPFVDLELPVAIVLVRDRVLKQPKGDRAFVELLLAARELGLDALQVACELTLDGGVITAAVVLNELRRLTAPPRPEAVSLPDQLRLQVEPLADCSRYDTLRGEQYVH